MPAVTLPPAIQFPASLPHAPQPCPYWTQISVDIVLHRFYTEYKLLQPGFPNPYRYFHPLFWQFRHLASSLINAIMALMYIAVCHVQSMCILAYLEVEMMWL